MPKEYIESAWFNKTAKQVNQDGTTTDVIVENTALKVGWNKNAPDGYVEVAVTPCVGGLFEDQSAQHMQFDREGLNRAVRTLRRARDQAFGADA